MSPSDLLQSATAPLASTLRLPRALLLFAHPDDEVIALGARLGRFGSAHILHATDGAPRNEEDSRRHGFASFTGYRDARSAELQSALALAGIPAVSHESLDIPDQGAALHLIELVHAILERLRLLQPEVLFTHPYEGGHPDHDACAFAAHRASALHARQGGTAPVVIEAASYHLGDSGIRTGIFLPHPSNPATVIYPLFPQEGDHKRALLACFTTQEETLRSFGVDHEAFRLAPQYSFTETPHASPVFYDGFAWGMRSAQFCDRVREADAQLVLEQAVA